MRTAFHWGKEKKKGKTHDSLAKPSLSALLGEERKKKKTPPTRQINDKSRGTINHTVVGLPARLQACNSPFGSQRLAEPSSRAQLHQQEVWARLEITALAPCSSSTFSAIWLKWLNASGFSSLTQAISQSQNFFFFSSFKPSSFCKHWMMWIKRMPYNQISDFLPPSAGTLCRSFLSDVLSSYWG